MTVAHDDPSYLPGRSEEEYQRLMEQARLYAGTTRALFVDAGVTTGMRALYIGCGVGDVSFLAASLVGQEGTVVGVDGDRGAVAIARERARSAGLDQVSFIESDVRELRFEDPFDVVVGRFVLMYLRDPADTVRRLLMHLRPGGIVAFEEFQIDFEGGQRASWPEVPLHEQALDWIRETFRSLGVETQMGFKLVRTFREAGLPDPRMRFHVPLSSSSDGPGYLWCAHTLRSVLPFIEGLGLATAETIDVDTLPARLREAVAARDAVVGWAPVVSAWAVKP